jgi:hypothetical protein
MSVKSKQHQKIIDILKNNLPALKIIEEYNVGDNLFIDIYLPDFKLGIETDGRQHYEFVEFFHKTYDKFEESKFLDYKKNLKCKENDIFLYRIKYDDKRNDLEIINDIFNAANSYHNNNLIIIENFTCDKCGILYDLRFKILNFNQCYFCHTIENGGISNAKKERRKTNIKKRIEFKRSRNKDSRNK